MAASEGKGLRVPRNPALALRELNRKHATPIVAEEPQKYTTILQTDKPTDKPTNKQANPQTDIPTNQQTDRQTNQPSNRQTNRPTDKQTDPPTNRQTNQPTRNSAAWSEAELEPEPPVKPRA